MSVFRRLVRAASLAGYYSFAWFLPGDGVPGLRAIYALRRVLARGFVEECGSGVKIKSKVYLGRGTGIRLGDRCSVGKDCDLCRDVWVGRDALIGPDVTIISISHEFSDRSVPVRDQGHRPQPSPVVIGDDVWIGARATVLPGACVGHGAVIGACAVVTKDVEPWAVVAGNPARVIGRRGGDMAAPDPNGSDDRFADA